MKITTYNVPFEQTSRDRIVDEQLLVPFKVEDTADADFSYNIGNSTTATITITGKKANYIRIDETTVDVKDRILRTPITYWFTTVKSIESGSAITYDCKLDVVLTYFLDKVHLQLDRDLGGSEKTVNVQRFHEDRYKIVGNDVVIDTQFLETKVGEFQYKGKNGNIINYKANTIKDWTNDVDPQNSTEIETYVFDNITRYKGWNIHYQNQMTGEDSGVFRQIVGESRKYWIKIKDEFGKVVYSEWLWNIAKGEDRLGGHALPNGDSFLIGPNSFQFTNGNLLKYEVLISSDTTYDANIPKKDDNVGIVRKNFRYGTADGRFLRYGFKDIRNDFFKNGQRYFAYAVLQQDVIKNKTSSIGTNGSHIVIAPVNLMDQTGTNVLSNFEDLPDGGVINVFLSPFELDFVASYASGGTQDKPVLNEAFLKIIETGKDIYYGFIDPNQYKLLEDIIGNDIELTDNNKLILKIPKTNVNLNKIDEWDVAMLPTISITQHVSNFNQELDIVNFEFFKEKRIEIITNELGLNFKIFNNKYKYTLFTENNYTSFFTSQSSSYLTTHKAQIEAQKKRIDLEKDLAIKGVQSSQASNFGGGILGAGMASFNPASYVNIALLGETKQMYRDLAQNKKDTIQAQINDLKNTPSIRNLGNEHSLNVMQPTGINGVGQFFLEIELPNKAILSKINEYLKRYGYKYDGYIIYTRFLWDTRETYNFLSIKDVRDELKADEQFDDSALELIDKELEAGIRIWHNHVGDYSKRNIEKKLLLNKK